MNRLESGRQRGDASIEINKSRTTKKRNRAQQIRAYLKQVAYSKKTQTAIAIAVYLSGDYVQDGMIDGSLLLSMLGGF